MKRKNRRITTKHSVVASSVCHFGSILAVLFVVVLLNVLANTSCKQLERAIGADERMLAKLEDSRMRESMRWEEMKTPEKIEAALLKHGLAMKPPKPDQIVHMKANGQPYAGQLSVARARQRSGFGTAKLAKSR